MSLVPLTLLSAVMLFSPLSARADPDPLIELDRVFQFVDSMPMRRAEMQRR